MGVVSFASFCIHISPPLALTVLPIAFPVVVTVCHCSHYCGVFSTSNSQVVKKEMAEREFEEAERQAEERRRQARLQEEEERKQKEEKLAQWREQKDRAAMEKELEEKRKEEEQKRRRKEAIAEQVCLAGDHAYMRKTAQLLLHYFHIP